MIMDKNDKMLRNYENYEKDLLKFKKVYKQTVSRNVISALYLSKSVKIGQRR